MKRKFQIIENSIINNDKTFRLLGFPKHSGLGSCYLKLVRRLVKDHGMRETVRNLKGLYNESVRYASGVPIRPSTPIWFKRNRRNNFPEVLLSFKGPLAGTNKSKRYALSILRTYESIILEPIPNLETVTSPSKGKVTFAAMKEDFEKFLKKSGFTRRLKERFKALLDESVKSERSVNQHFSSKRGIEGPTLLTAGKQTLAIDEDLLTLLDDFNKHFRKGSIRDIIEENKEFFEDADDIYRVKSEDNQTYLGRITFVPDKGGKSRLVAIGNYWIQDCLKPFHRVLYKLLREIPQDGTYDQTRQSDRVKTQSSIGPVWSYDLTQATDRFPIEMQVSVLKFIHPEIGSLWESILGSMSFKYKDQVLKYAVGQPMGLYSSWAVFTVTHHVLIHYCAFKERAKAPFQEYAVLGDDVAIWKKAVAIRYKALLEKLDVSINLDKSFSPPNDDQNVKFCVAEFAKRVYVRGEEITALSPDIQNSSWSSWWNIPEFLQYLQDHNFLLESVPVSRIAKTMRLSAHDQSYLCCSLKIKQLLDAQLRVNLDSCNNGLLDRINVSDIISARCELLVKQASDLWGELFDLEEKTGQALENRLVGPIPDRLYLKNVIDYRISQLLQLESTLVSFLPKEEYEEYFEGNFIPDDKIGDKPLPKLSEIEYLPKVDIDEILNGFSPSERHRVYRGRYIREILQKILEPPKEDQVLYEPEF